jgi:hypothetical protein
MKSKTSIKTKEFLLVALFFMIVSLITVFAFKCNAQCYTYQPGQTSKHGLTAYMAAAATKLKPGIELQAGYRYEFIALTAGYVVILDAAEPVLFQIRLGGIIKNRFHVYAGYVRVTKSSDDKTQNYNSYAAGLQYHFMHFDTGTFYTTFNYTPRFPTVGIGMTINLVKEPK